MMKEIRDNTEIETPTEPLPAPGGIGMAVAIDWGLAVQVLLTPIIYAFSSQSRPMIFTGLDPVLGKVLFFVIALPFAGLFVFFGEMVRRGRNWTRWIQLIANALLSLAGILSLVSVYQSIKAGNFWSLVTEVILIVFSPLIVWRLSRPATVRWFKVVTVAQARKRHGGRWVWVIALCAVVGGVLQTIAAMQR